MTHGFRLVNHYLLKNIDLSNTDDIILADNALYDGKDLVDMSPVNYVEINSSKAFLVADTLEDFRKFKESMND